ncbi:MAG TPA: saccharopine dehydrogenase NADP-binding domain-containing protein, partial [Pirellulales bacterium]|nr:saccharopine dehydrogenase NADP-binding domain-containing protein [Pirellulales bacterium]
MVSFGRQVLFVGYGSVAQCALPILVKHVKVPLKNITVIDFEDRAALLKPWTEQGVRFEREKITPEN